jgi:hypothetical protein
MAHPLATITCRRAWDKARRTALTQHEYRSPLARRPYDLRHACLSTWLNGGVAATQVAEWAGHSVEMLPRGASSASDADSYACCAQEPRNASGMSPDTISPAC